MKGDQPKFHSKDLPVLLTNRATFPVTDSQSESWPSNHSISEILKFEKVDTLFDLEGRKEERKLMSGRCEPPPKRPSS